MNSFKVLNLYSGNLYGGIEAMLVTMARSFNTLPGITMEFGLCFPGRLKQELVEAGATVHDLGSVRLRYPWTGMLANNRLRKVLDTHRYDAVITHACWPHAIFSDSVRRSGMPLVFWQHDLASGQSRLDRTAARTKPDLVISNSQYTANTLTNLFPNTPNAVIYTPLPPYGQGTPSESERAKIRDEFQAHPEDVVIVHAARMESWKGHRLLLDALALLRDQPRWKLWIVGGTQRDHEVAYLQSLRKQAEDTGIADRVSFLGQRNDVRLLLSVADIHCQPNISPEPLGLVYVEALYAGLPLVTTALGGASEIINNQCGIRVPAADRVELSNALRLLITNPVLRKQLGAAGPARAEELCDPGRVLLKLQDLCLPLRAQHTTTR